MRQPPSDEQRRRPFTAPVSPPLSYWLKHLGLLLLGAGLGAAGMKWMSPQTNASTEQPAGALEVEASADPGSAEWNTSDSANQRSAPARGSANAKVEAATVCVKTFGPGGGEACASGVSIDPQLVGIDPSQGAVVLTNFHVIAQPIAGLPVQLGGKGEVFRSQVLKQSPEFDLAVLFVPKARFPQAALADSSPAPGTSVRAIGFPNDQPLTIKDSTLLGETQNCLAVSPCLAMQQGTITNGNSGGPLVADEQVIGITEGETTEEIAIPIEQIQQFLSDNASFDDTPSDYGSPERRSTRQFPAADRFPPQFDPNLPPMREPHYHVHPPMDEPYPPQGWL